jgi:hypothetical protein
MKRIPIQLRRPRTPIRLPAARPGFRPAVERLETRLAPANVDVLSYHYDALLSGNNAQETILHPGPASDPTALNAVNFGKLFSQPVDGQIYASPLYKADLLIGGVSHNVVFVVTEHDSVYAFDADTGAQLWQRSFITGGPGGPTTPGITTVPSADTSGNVFPEYGITGTPVIDYNAVTQTGIMYVVAQTKEVRGAPPVAHYVDTLYAINITDGSDRASNATVIIGDSLADDATHTTVLSVPGIGAGSSAATAAVQTAGSGYAAGDTIVLNGGNPINNVRTVLQVTSVDTGGAISGVSIQTRGTYNSAPSDPVGQLSTSGSGTGATFNMTWMVQFNAWRQLQRPALTMVQGVVYVTFAGYNDQGAYHGWVVGYRASDLALQGFFNFSPNARAAGIWQSGGGLATDGTSLYFATGNTFSGPMPGFSPADGNYGESVIKLSVSGGTLSVTDYFTPYNWASLDGGDLDLGSGGTMLLPDYVGSSDHPHLMVETGKTGRLYLIDRDHMGGNDTAGGVDHVVQILELGGPGIWGNPSFVQVNATTGIIYYHGSQADLKAVQISGATLSAPVAESNLVFGYPGGQPVISSDGTARAIAWDMRVDGTSGAAILYAYDATPNNRVLTELYNSSATSLRDKAGTPVKFTAPTITNGHVFVGAGNSLSVFGTFDPHTMVPAAPMGLAGTATTTGDIAIRLTWTNPSPNDATGIRIERSLTPNPADYREIAIVGRNDTSFADTGLSPGTQYYYRIRGANQIGNGAYSDPAGVVTHVAAPILATGNVTHAEIDLSWTQSGNDHYQVERSFGDQLHFITVANNIPAMTPIFHDTDPILATQRGTYYYRVTAFNMNPPDMSVSNVAAVSNALGVDHMAGFITNDDVTVNGNAQFTNGLVRLTTNVNNAGTVFTQRKVGIDTFSTSFTFRIHDGSNPPADGFTFILQNISSAALGGNGGGFGYSGIGNSVAVKFDMYTQATSHSTTGLFFNGDLNPAQQIDLIDSGIDLRNANVKQVDLSYDGATLTEIITDTVTHQTFTHSYTVNIPSVIGDDAAYAGFGGGTGGLNALQDIQTWTYDPGPGRPGAPSNLVVSVGTSGADLAWTSHSVNEAGFRVERSDNALNNFHEIGTVTAPRFPDGNLIPGIYYYRVRAYNGLGNSPYTAVSYVVIGPTNPFTDHNAGFADHADLQLNGGAGVVGTRLRLTDGGGSEARTSWTTTRVGVLSFNVSFVFQVQNVQGSADGMAFALQNNDPGVVGGAGGGIGYSGIGHSVAVMFDLYSGGNHHSTTNFLMNGNKTGSIDMGPAGIVLGSNHPLRVDLTYDINQLALSETVTDTVTGAVFVHVYTNVNVPQIIGAQTAYAGFTGGTGGETAVQDIVSWTGRFLDPANQPVSRVTLSASNATAGSAVTVTVSARDALNNVKPGYTGTVHFASSDQQATLPADYPFMSTDNGVHAFTGVVLRTAGTQTISAQDTGTPSILGSTTVTITAAAASQFLLAYPAPITAANLRPFTVTAQDPYGNTAPTYRGTVHLTSSDGQALLSPDATFTADDNGVHAFSAAFFTAGTQTLTATDTQTGAIVGTQTITVLPAAASGLVVSGFPSPAQAGSIQHFTVTAMDPYHNVATGYTGTIDFTSSDPRGLFPSHYTFNAGDAGSHQFEALLETAGTQSITAADTADGFSGTQSGIVVTAARAVSFSVQAPSNVQAGTPFVLRVVALDQFGNVVTDYAGTVHLSTSDSDGYLPPDYTFQPSDHGVAYFPVILRTRGPQTITITDTADPTLTMTITLMVT